MNPTQDRIYIKRLGGWTEEATDLIVVEDKPSVEIGLVEAVGPGRWQRVKKSREYVRAPMDVQVGDRVLFDRYAGTDVEAGLGDKYVILVQNEVLAVVTE